MKKALNVPAKVDFRPVIEQYFIGPQEASVSKKTINLAERLGRQPTPQDRLLSSAVAVLVSALERYGPQPLERLHVPSAINAIDQYCNDNHLAPGVKRNYRCALYRAFKMCQEIQTNPEMILRWKQFLGEDISRTIVVGRFLDFVDTTGAMFHEGDHSETIVAFGQFLKNECKLSTESVDNSKKRMRQILIGKGLTASAQNKPVKLLTPSMENELNEIAKKAVNPFGDSADLLKKEAIKNFKKVKPESIDSAFQVARNLIAFNQNRLGHSDQSIMTYCFGYDNLAYYLVHRKDEGKINVTTAIGIIDKTKSFIKYCIVAQKGGFSGMNNEDYKKYKESINEWYGKVERSFPKETRNDKIKKSGGLVSFKTIHDNFLVNLQEEAYRVFEIHQELVLTSDPVVIRENLLDLAEVLRSACETIVLIRCASRPKDIFGCLQRRHIIIRDECVLIRYTPSKTENKSSFDITVEASIPPWFADVFRFYIKEVHSKLWGEDAPLFPKIRTSGSDDLVRNQGTGSRRVKQVSRKLFGYELGANKLRKIITAFHVKNRIPGLYKSLGHAPDAFSGGDRGGLTRLELESYYVDSNIQTLIDSENHANLYLAKVLGVPEGFKVEIKQRPKKKINKTN